MITSKTDWPVYPVITRDDPEQLELAARFGRECSGAQRDNVDMIVPSHYSAAPSGDLPTMSKRFSIVQGESRRSVPNTGVRPQSFRPQLAASHLAALHLAAPQLTAPQRAAMSGSSAAPLATECSSSAANVAAGHSGNQWNAGKCAVAPGTREQMKHGSFDTIRGQLRAAGGAVAVQTSHLQLETSCQDNRRQNNRFPEEYFLHLVRSG